MGKKQTSLTIALFFLFICLPALASARDLTAGVAILPPHSQVTEDGRLTGGFIEIIRAMDRVYTQGRISIKLLPFARSITDLVQGKTDFHIPLIRNPSVPTETLPYVYASEPLLEVAFVLYTRSDRPVPPLDKLGEYRIDVIRGTAPLFLFKVSEIGSFEQGILKVQSGRSDGFLTEQDAADKFLMENSIKNIHRTHFATWQASILVAKGPEGEKTDRIISTALRQLKETGELKGITDRIHKPFSPWQPGGHGKP